MQAAVGGQPLERLALQHELGPEVGREARLADEEAAVDPVLGARLLAEAADAVVAVEHGDAERQLRAHHRHRRDGAGGGVAARQRREVHVGDAVAVGGEVGRAAEPVRDGVDAAAGRRVRPGVDALDGRARGPLRGGGELLDQLGQVARQQQHAPDSLGGEDRDDVPDDRQPADLDERLRDVARVLLQAGAAAAAEDDRGVDAARAHAAGVEDRCLHPLAPGRLLARGDRSGVVAVDARLDRRPAAVAEDEHDRQARRRVGEPQQHAAVPAVVDDRLDDAGERRDAVAARRDRLAGRGRGKAELARQRLPALVARRRAVAERPDPGPAAAGEVGHVQPQALQRDAHALGHAADLLVPVRACAEAAHHHADDARSSRSGLDEPLGGERDGLPRGGPLLRLREPARRVPARDAAGALHAVAHVVGEAPALALLHLGGVHPGAEARAGGDRVPDLLGRARDLDLQIDPLRLVVGHRSSWGSSGSGCAATTTRCARPPSSW